ncbi:MAG TPA: hypothetical protein VJN18_35930 [Polyangiaceae bacterium]|nr:hypothetical protein [Polyangiaceae bacterium]
MNVNSGIPTCSDGTGAPPDQILASVDEWAIMSLPVRNLEALSLSSAADAPRFEVSEPTLEEVEALDALIVQLDPARWGRPCGTSADCPAGGTCEDGVCEAPVTGVWESKPQAGSPDGYILPVGGYDATLGGPMVYAGYGGANLGTPKNDVFVYIGGAWQLVPVSSPKPPGGCCLGFARDATRGVSWTFGGGAAHDDLWSFDSATRSWTQVARAGLWPPSNIYDPMAFDINRGRAVFVAGWGGGSTADVWEWDVALQQWHHRGGDLPWRHRFALGYDARRGEVILFGGAGRTSAAIYPWNADVPLNETWAWNGTSWTRRMPTTSPPPRSLGALGFDSDRNRLVLYGGREANDGAGATWEWDGSNWHPTAGASGAFQANGVVLSYDSARRRTVAYGYSGTAEYYTVGNSCAQASECGNGQCIDGVCCAQSTCQPGWACNTNQWPGECAQF